MTNETREKLKIIKKIIIRKINNMYKSKLRKKNNK